MPQLIASFRRRWIVANTAAFVIAYILYTPVAHGLTGSHGRDLTPAQLVAHCVALALVGVMVTGAQRRVLMPFISLSWQRVIFVTIAFIVAFWAGYYQPVMLGPDTDSLFGYFVLGCGMWLGKVPVKNHRVAATVALLSFPLACFVGQLALLIAVAILGATPDVQGSALVHSLYWLVVGGTTGALGGWIGGLALARILSALPAADAS